MDIAAEQEIRARAGNLALAWYSEKHGEFAGRDKADYGALIVAAHVAADESRQALHRWVDAGRRASLSWTEIGALIGTSKQAAQQRFGGGEAEAEDGGERIVRTGATAFNELAIMAEEGRRGRELVRTGALSLVFRQTRSHWEYRRVTALFPDSARARLERSGWAYVSSWYPFHYFKRRIANP
ncbi:MAG TPA: hypothetical protein VGW40_05535 [Allosphingosinicella sp.]|nr:hypothetical protein [Allosphingosinicella sp.]